MAAGADMAGGAIQVVGGMMADINNNNMQDRNNKRNTKLQYKYNNMMAEENQRRNLEMWNKTNYEAQRKHMENAGLNPALMYGQSGGGGVSSSGGTGQGVSMGESRPSMMGTVAGMNNMAEMALLQAQKENIDADTENKKASNPNINADTDLKTSNKALTDMQTENQRILNNIANETQEAAIDTVVANYHKAEGEAASAVSAGKYAEESNKAQVYKLQQEGMLTAIKISAEKAGIALTEEQTRAISENLAQGWEELYQKGRGNDNQEGMVNIAGFKAKADYAIDKANVDLRAKELMVRGAEAFANGLGKFKGQTTTTNSHSSTPKGETYHSSKTTTR